MNTAVINRDTGGPAFPQDHLLNSGATLRDYFAAKAMQGLLASQIHGFNDALSKGPWAEMSYEMADAMIAERNNQ